ncbi:M28 family peptidase [Thalassotalea sp. HSM 43]|uniref:M28 family peptidase n=1 Tax=Thalassotalea sp. HSM 43 TaxID=2552945 RepID=UPI001080CD9F|nr:M28 family peptidase [Thalassotalea sp. HSM 43]QBY03550.1 M28 family peptidase [Thalassotalea sp. HSM 43]
MKSTNIPANKFSINAVITPLILFFLVWLSITAQTPADDAYANSDMTEFSSERAYAHLNNIAAKPHFVGTAEHQRVRNYLVEQLDAMGLDVQVFEHTGAHSRYSYMAANTRNIVAKIPGKRAGNAIALVSHYDSSLHSSPGASDAGSGVVTIVEGVRAFLAKNQQADNDIIIVITDGEERGLLGAKAFVNHHPWAKQVKVVLNFEARGSGGPSYMIMETNGGNKQLVQAFSDAGIEHPIANSLMYSVYKMLPNDTDLTIFREDGNIQGYNFAFIDDHFDYHTVNDSVARLDKASLNHQADYLLAMLNYFANADLTTLESADDMVFFNVLNLAVVSYPFSWVMLMLIIASVLFVAITYKGLRSGVINVAAIGVSFAALLATIIAAAAFGFGGWLLLQNIVAAYAESPHNFTYNGHWLMLFFFSSCVAIGCRIYAVAKDKLSLPALLIAPIVVWLLLNLMLAMYLPGAGFLILPVFFALLVYYILLERESKSASESEPKDQRKPWSLITIVALLLSLPVVIILAPLIASLIIGLGLNALYIGCILTVLVLSLLMPIIRINNSQSFTLWSSLLLALGCFAVSSWQAGYSAEQPKPSSINYLLNADSNKAYWFSHSKRLDSFSEQFIGAEANDVAANEWPQPLYPSYRRSTIRHFSEAEAKDLAKAKIAVRLAAKTQQQQSYLITITPQRDSNLLQLASLEPLNIVSLKVNGQAFRRAGQNIGENTVSGMFLHYTLSQPRESIEVELTLPSDASPQLKLFETSYDLMQQFDWIKPRQAHLMPEPFAINDAVIIGQSIEL